MSDDFTKFSFKRMDGTSAVYGAAHELHNEVLLTFPEGYFGSAWPAWVDVPDFWVMPGEQPISDFAPDRSGIAADDDPSMRPEVDGPQPIGQDVAIPLITSMEQGLKVFPQAKRMFRHREAKAPKCEGCGEPSWYLEPRETLPPDKPEDEVKVMDLCEACVEVAEHADPKTGSYGAAAAERIIADRVRGIRK